MSASSFQVAGFFRFVAERTYLDSLPRVPRAEKRTRYASPASLTDSLRTQRSMPGAFDFHSLLLSAVHWTSNFRYLVATAPPHRTLPAKKGYPIAPNLKSRRLRRICEKRKSKWQHARSDGTPGWFWYCSFRH